MLALTGSERDDAANGIVRRNANGDAITRHDFDTEPAHPAAQLGEHFMTGVALNSIQPPAVHRYDRPLHVDEIVFAQTGSKSFRVRQPLWRNCSYSQ
jgi:hypothetical protein